MFNMDFGVIIAAPMTTKANSSRASSNLESDQSYKCYLKVLFTTQGKFLVNCDTKVINYNRTRAFVR